MKNIYYVPKNTIIYVYDYPSMNFLGETTTEFNWKLTGFREELCAEGWALYTITKNHDTVAKIKTIDIVHI